MGLIDLKTDLTSLRYGKDTLGGGYSGQPYIQTPIPDSFNNLGAREDFILRGGINAVKDSLTDIKRLGKMFIDTKSPNGLLFIAKQQLLSRTAVRTQTSGRTLNEGVYSPLNTLAQAGIVAFGGHLNKQGINPFEYTGAYANNDNLYSTRMKNYNQEWLDSPDGSLKNRLFALYESKIQNNEIGGFAKVNNISSLNGNILSYTGGPGSILGIGNTDIRFTDQRTGLNNRLAKLSGADQNYFYGKDQQRSVNENNVQVGGLQVKVGDGDKSWIKGGIYFNGGAKNIYNPSILFPEYANGLSSNNVNSSQINSLDKIPDGELTWTPNQKELADGRNWYNLAISSSTNSKNSSSVSQAYEQSNKQQLGIPTTPSDRVYLDSVGVNSKLFNLNAEGAQTWTPNQQEELADGRNWNNLAVSSSIKSKNTSSVSQAYEQSNKELLGIPETPGDKVYLDSVGVNSKLFNLNAEGAQTWTPNQNNPDSSKYYKTLTLIGDQFKNKGVSGKYSRLTNEPINNYFNFLGAQIDTYNHNVYNPITGSNTWPKNNQLVNANGTYVYNQKDLIETPLNTFKLSGSPRIQDFRRILRDVSSQNPQSITAKSATTSGQLAESLPYSGPDAGNLEKRVNIGDPGKRANKDYSNYANGVSYGSIDTTMGFYSTGLDKINSLPIYRSENALRDANVTNDFVKFRIAVIDNDKPNFKTFMNFRAFLGPISDAYSAAWNNFQYLGRGENFYTYGGFTRTISLSWTVAAQSKQELIPMYKKLNFLASTLAPDYSPKGYMRGNLVQLTIGGYLFEQPGFITGLTYEMGEDSPWEIGIGTTPRSEDGTVKELTQIIKVTGFNFTPIQRFVPRLQDNSFGGDGEGFASSYGPEHFISLANGGGDNNNYEKYNTSV
jgi:hypothetical protein